MSTSSLDGLDGLVSAKPDRIYLSLECFDRDADCLWNDRKLEKALELAAGAGIEVFVRLPRILKAEEIDLAIRRLFCASDAVGRSISGFLVGNPGIAYAIASITGRHGLCGGSSTCEVETYGGTEGDGGALRRRLTRAALHADYTIGIANSATVGGLRDLGFAGVTVSPELNMNRIRELVSPGDLLVEVIVHGRLPLMVAEQCVYGYLSGCDSGRAGCTKGRDVYGLLDRKGYVFPMSSDQFCRTHVFNSRPLCMLQSIDDLRKLSSVDLYRIEGYGESNASLAKTVTAYREAISGRAERVSCKALDIVGKQGFTRGHFYRGAE